MGTNCTPGHFCQEARPQNVQDGTAAVAAGPTPGTTGYVPSFELGACFMPVHTSLRLTEYEMQVLAWLRMYKADIEAAEAHFEVTRIAIAGAIAWEMLENPHAQANNVTVGPGKVHVINIDSHHFLQGVVGLAKNFFGGDYGEGTVAKETEDSGKLPKQTYEQRKQLLSTPAGAIQYIGAIMSATADLAEKYKFDSIRDDPIILTWAYQSQTLKTWEAHLKAKSPSTGFTGGNPMDEWVGKHIPFLEDAVGKSDL